MSSISGGSRWHWRAWRNAANWRALSKAVDGFHRDFGPQGGELLLFGCSKRPGYKVSRALLRWIWIRLQNIFFACATPDSSSLPGIKAMLWIRSMPC
ncbi:MAG: hypothetical protein EBT32_07715 [Betaproteobacteria bacterium]|nr:hypothetical protein [Betaproteobacteria bacterium]